MEISKNRGYDERCYLMVHVLVFMGWVGDFSICIIHNVRGALMSQQDIIDFLKSQGAINRRTAVPARHIKATLKKSNLPDSLRRLREIGDIKFDLRDHDRYYYWLPRRPI
jgi:hypothetical protein